MATYTSNYGWTKPSGSDNVDISVLNNNLDDQDSTIHDAFLNMAPPFSESSTYAVDDIVLYGTGLYKCYTAVVTPGSWTGSTNWQVYKLSEGGSGGGGTSNYNQLTNKPQINHVELSGNKTAAQLGLMASDGVVANPTGQTTGTLTTLEVGGTKYAVGGGSSLEAGDYIDITEGVISVKKEKGEYSLERYVLQSTGGGAPKLVVKKYIDSELISTNEYANNTAHVNIDDTLEIWYSYNPYNWHYKLLVDGIDHSAGYEYEFSYEDTTEYPVDFHISAGDSTDLVTKGDLATVATSGSYNDLTNKPSINGVTLSGNKTTSDLGLQDELTFDNVPTDGSNNPVKSDGIYDSEKDIYAIMGKMGAKNLIPYPYDGTTYGSGVTYVPNSDGTVSVNGTGGSDTNRYILVPLSEEFSIQKGVEYILSDGISNSGSSTYRLVLAVYNGSTYTGIAYGTLAGITKFTIPNDTVFDRVSIYISVIKNVQVSDVTFKPMLRLASDTDDTYQPYAKTNRELTDEIATKTKNFQRTIAEWNALTTAEKKAYDHASIPDSIDGGVTFPANKVVMTGGGNVEDAITNLVKAETKQVTVTSDANHVAMLGVSKPNVVVNVEISGVIVLGYTTYANEWLCSLADYSGTQITSGTYTATIYYI